MGNLSQNFDTSEFDINDSSEISPRLIEGLEILRSKIGDRPLAPTSGVRQPDKNKAVDGVDDSRHLPKHADAADVCPPDGMSLEEFYAVASTVPAFRDGGIGAMVNKGCLHVDARETGRALWAVKSVIGADDDSNKEKNVFTTI